MPVTEYKCTIISNQKLTPTVFELKFELDQPMSFRSGQFISIVIPKASKSGKDLRRAYSIASWPEKHPLELCIKKVEGGPGTTYLSSLKPGDSFQGFAPYGDFVFKTTSDRHACFISTGTGLAPFRAMIQSNEFKKSPPKSTTCLFGVRSEDELLYQNELSDFPEVKWIPCVSQPQPSFSGYSGRVSQYLKGLDSTFPWATTDFYLCGNGAMIKEIRSFLINDKGIQKNAVFQEVYFRPTSS